MYRILVTISLLLVAGTSAYMSVYGLVSVFVSSAIVIICMGLGMEIGKILTVSQLYRHWQKLNGFTRTLYMLIISVLVFLTSIEIIGFLSQSHMSVTRELRIAESTLNSLKNEAAILKEQISVIRDAFDRYVAPNSWESKVKIIKQFIRECGSFLSSSIRTDQPERYAQNYEELIRSYVDALQNTSAIFPRL